MDTDQGIVALEQIPYVDYPEIRINENERTEMPFRYVKGADGQPIMPSVRYWYPQVHAEHISTDMSRV